MSRLVLTAALGLALTLAESAPAAAQDRVTFDDASGLTWGVGIFELSMAAAVVAISAGDACQGWGCLVLAVMIPTAGLVLGIAGGLVAAVIEAPSDVPFVWHHSWWGFVGTAAILYGAFEDSGSQPESGWPIVAPAIGVGLGMGAYAFLRREEMLRDPDLAGTTHFFSWVPPTLGILTQLVLADLLDEPDVLAPILAGAIGLITWGIGVALVETRLAE